jgi:kynurenine formamidase
MTPDRLPTYRELPETDGGARSAWGLFGAADNRGLINLQTATTVTAAATLVRTGRVFSLDVPLDFFGPTGMAGRGAATRTLLGIADQFFDDYMDNLYLQGASQWDSLAHVAFAPDAFYNGVTADDVRAGRRNTIEHWANTGIVGRAVLLDLARALPAAGRPFDPMTTYQFTLDDLETARQFAGLEYRSGDVLLVNTGYLDAYSALTTDERDAIEQADPTLRRHAGIEHSAEMAEYLWNTHCAAIESDNSSVEVFPLGEDVGEGGPAAAGWPFGFLHRILIAQFGMALGEFFWLRDLADDCADDGTYDMFFCSAPLKIPGGVGSPANALAIK